jgi:hypothetical protein
MSVCLTHRASVTLAPRRQQQQHPVLLLLQPVAAMTVSAATAAGMRGVPLSQLLTSSDPWQRQQQQQMGARTCAANRLWPSLESRAPHRLLL